MRQTVSHFEITEKLGEGGAGVVYKARDLRLDRFVALKFLSPQLLGSESAKRRFQREARLICNLDHPNIANIFEVGEEDGQQFLVLEYLAGGTLSSRIRDLHHAGQQFALRQVVEYALQVADGLAYAHRRGVIHRDIKPANVLCTEERKVKITDFGLAQDLKGSDYTDGARLAGTIPYLSPEQVKGKPADHRSDIYACGVLIFELATGKRPFQGSSEIDTLQSIARDPVPRLQRFRPDAPAELAQLVSRMLAREPEDRFSKMEQVVAELRSIQDKSYPASERVETTVLSRTISLSRSEQSLRSVRLTRRSAWAVGAVAVAFLVFAAGLILWPQRCVWVASWFGECHIPAVKHIGVLDFETEATGEDRALVKGIRELLATRVGRLARFYEGFGVHMINDKAEASVVNLNITARARRGDGTATINAELWNPRDGLLLRELPMEARVRDASSLQDDLALRIAEMLGLDLTDEQRTAMAAGSSMIREAFEAYLLGLGHLELGETDAAVAAFEEAVHEDPYYASAHAGLADAYRLKYHETGDESWIRKAQESCRTAIERSRDDPLPEAHVAQGRIDFDLQRYSEAAKAFQKALDLDPINHDTRWELAKTHAALGDLETAEAVAKEGVSIRPECWLAHLDLGRFYLQQGAFNKVEGPWRRVVELAPQSLRAHSNLGGLQYFLQLPVEAERSWLRALELAPNSDVYSNLGQLYLENRCFRDAAEALQVATRLDETNYLARGNLGEACRMVPELKGRALGVFNKAIELAEGEVAANSEDPQPVRMLAFYHARLAQDEKASDHRKAALDRIEKAIGMAPDNVLTRFRAGYLYEILGERKRALDEMERALAGGFPAKQICTSPELEELRLEPTLAGLLNEKCEQHVDVGGKLAVGQTFVCPADRPKG